MSSFRIIKTKLNDFKIKILFLKKKITRKKKQLKKTNINESLSFSLFHVKLLLHILNHFGPFLHSFKLLYQLCITSH